MQHAKLGGRVDRIAHVEVADDLGDQQLAAAMLANGDVGEEEVGRQADGRACDDEFAFAVEIGELGAIVSSAGVDAGVVDHGEKVTFRLRYKTTRRIEKPDVRLSIDREDDLHTMTFSTSTDGAELAYLDGEGELIVTSPPIRLTSDFFLANVAVREHGSGKLLVAQIVGHFHVRDPVYSSTQFGVLHESAEWKHETASAPAAAPALRAVGS